MPGAVDEAVVPLEALDRHGGRPAILEQHQRRQIDRAGRAPVDEDDALVADDLHPVVVGVVDRIHHQVRRVRKVQHAVAPRRLELKHDRGGRVHVLGRDHPAAVDPGVDARHIAHQIVRQREEMVAVVEDQRAAAALRLVEAPEPRAERHLPRRLALARAHVHADHLRLADLAGVDHLFGADVRGVEDEVLVDAQHDLRLRRRRDHPVGLRHAERHRLLHGDVLAGLARRHRHVSVQVMRHQQLDQVDVAVGQELVEVGVDLRRAPRLGALLGQLPVRVTHGDDAGVISAAVAHFMEVGDAPTADDGNA